MLQGVKIMNTDSFYKEKLLSSFYQRIKLLILVGGGNEKKNI